MDRCRKNQGGYKASDTARYESMLKNRLQAAAEASAWAAASRLPRAIQSPDAAVGAPAKGAAGSPFQGLRLRNLDIDLPRSISP